MTLQISPEIYLNVIDNDADVVDGRRKEKELFLKNIHISKMNII